MTFEIPSVHHHIPAETRFVSASRNLIKTMRRSAARLVEQCADENLSRHADSPYISESEKNKDDPQPARDIESQLLDRCVWLSVTGAHSILDHIDALIADLGRNPPPAWSVISTARVALEGAATVHYLLDANISRERRQLRTAARDLHAVEEDLKMADFLSSAVPNEARQQMRERKQTLMQNYASINISRNKGPLVKGDLSEPLQINATGLVTSLTEHTMPGIYKLTSGVIHSQGWMLHEAIDPETGKLRANANIISTSVRIVQGSLSILTRAMGDFHGIDISAIQDDLDLVDSEYGQRFVDWRERYYAWQYDGRKGSRPTY